MEVAVVRNEGVGGVCASMGGGPALGGAVVQCSGHAWRMGAADIARHTERLPVLRQRLILDLDGLAARSCECYAVVRQAFERRRTVSVPWPLPDPPPVSRRPVLLEASQRAMA